MACKVRILPSAERELDEIVSYLAEFGLHTAKRFTDEWRRKLEGLASGTIEYALSHLPELEDLGYRAYRVGSYIALYYRDGSDAVVAHVFHYRRDYARMIIETDDGEGLQDLR
ncbi:MAG TPA: type II toxin-antitoxin system RelE/ParE family toxin [Atopobiaceae bacterium]|nr:type II toxin-antitoxin system RelE/ParE family toxin [Atopobiaceae bacterium]